VVASRAAVNDAREPLLPSPGQSQRSSQAARNVFVGLVASYLVVLGVLYALGLFGFVFKTMVVPALFIVAFAAGRFRVFVRDWSVFIGAVVLFDSMRGLIYGCIVRFQWPIYMGYAYRLEHALFGDPIPSTRLQHAFMPSGEISGFERFLVVIHASHFLVFFFFGLLVWLVRGLEFRRYALAFIVLMYSALVIYACVPTVPPWMAAERFYVIDAITQVPRAVYNLSVPSLAEAFDINPVAAMPSLHTAFPVLMALIALHHFAKRGLWMLMYAACAVFGVVYMGEHYVIDVIGGASLASIVYLLSYRATWVTRWLERSVESGLVPALCWGGLLLALAQGAGYLAVSWAGREVPTEAFIRRELDGKSPTANYYRGLNAYYAGDCQHALPLFLRASREMPNESKRARALQLRAECTAKLSGQGR
jgi:membrane-associated phospholipid phosphatase